jgi:hypothetical protein
MDNDRYEVPPPGVFRAAAIESFGFLLRDFGFVELKNLPQISTPSMYTRVVFESPAVTLTVENDRGSDNIILDLKTPPNWLKQDTLKTFDLSAIVMALAPHEFDSAPAGVREGTLSIEAECRSLLEWSAQLLRKYCEPVLRGNPSLLQPVYETTKLSANRVFEIGRAKNPRAIQRKR